VAFLDAVGVAEPTRAGRLPEVGICAGMSRGRWFCLQFLTTGSIISHEQRDVLGRVPDHKQAKPLPSKKDGRTSDRPPWLGMRLLRAGARPQAAFCRKSVPLGRRVLWLPSGSAPRVSGDPRLDDLPLLK